MDTRGRRDGDTEPLKAEALARDEWRGEEGTSLDQSDAPGHTLPASERGPSAADEEDGGGSAGPLGTMLPPD